jgi:hypothetical protein
MCWGLRGGHTQSRQQLPQKNIKFTANYFGGLQLIRLFDLSYKYIQAVYAAVILVAGCNGRCKRRDSYPLILCAVP